MMCLSRSDGRIFLRDLCVSGRLCEARAAAEAPLAAHVEALARVSTKDLDIMVSEHLNEEFFTGGDGAMASRVLAAVNCALPAIGRMSDHLPRARQTAAAFRRRAPPTSRLPLPEGVVVAVAMVMTIPGQEQAALAILVAYHAYLRPGELARVLWAMVHPPAAAAGGPRWVSILLHPAELGVSSKTRQFDETISVDWPWLGQAMLRWKVRRPPGEALAGVPSATLSEWFRDAAAQLRADNDLGNMVLYRLGRPPTSRSIGAT